MTVPLGQLRTPVELLELFSTSDDAAGESKRYLVSGRAMVKIVPLGGREFLEARQVVAEVTHEITGHYEELKSVTETFRIRDTDTGVEYDVEVVLPDQARDAIKVFAKTASS